MAERPVFVSQLSDNFFFNEELIEFEWFAGMSVSQKQKSISSLHDEASKKGIQTILEVSTKSDNELGSKLSAFNLSFINQIGNEIFVESAFQGSKVYATDGPHTDLYSKTPIEAKRDPRIDNDKQIIGFEYFGESWANEPKTLFYDWLYMYALQFNIEHSGDDIYKSILDYDAFTDIEFNPKKSLNCQARACAVFVSLYRKNLLVSALKNRKSFLKILSVDDFYKEDSSGEQLNLNF